MYQFEWVAPIDVIEANRWKNFGDDAIFPSAFGRLVGSSVSLLRIAAKGGFWLIQKKY